MTLKDTINVSMLEPPEPMERILDAIETLTQGEYLQVLIHREPFPLYHILEDDGFSHYIRLGEQTAYELFIWHTHDKIAESEINSQVKKVDPNS